MSHYSNYNQHCAIWNISEILGDETMKVKNLIGFIGKYPD